MKIGDQWQVLDSTPSTQTVATQLLAQGSSANIVFAHDQTTGRGRFGREWLSTAGESLAMSLVFSNYPDHPKPWLIGMSVGLAAAIEVDCQIQWPNDLVIAGRKVGGVLTEVHRDPNGALVPIVGVGINVNQGVLPEAISAFATSLFIATGIRHSPLPLAGRIVDRIRQAPSPDSWSAISGQWSDYDDTPGKCYKMANGSVVVAEGIGSDGALIARSQEELISVLAAEALFGESSGF